MLIRKNGYTNTRGLEIFQMTAQEQTKNGFELKYNKRKIGQVAKERAYMGKFRQSVADHGREVTTNITLIEIRCDLGNRYASVHP